MTYILETSASNYTLSSGTVQAYASRVNSMENAFAAIGLVRVSNPIVVSEIVQYTSVWKTASNLFVRLIHRSAGGVYIFEVSGSSDQAVWTAAMPMVPTGTLQANVNRRFFCCGDDFFAFYTKAGNDQFISCGGIEKDGDAVKSIGLHKHNNGSVYYSDCVVGGVNKPNCISLIGKPSGTTLSSGNDVHFLPIRHYIPYETNPMKSIVLTFNGDCQSNNKMDVVTQLGIKSYMRFTVSNNDQIMQNAADLFPVFLLEGQQVTAPAWL